MHLKQIFKDIHVMRRNFSFKHGLYTNKKFVYFRKGQTSFSTLVKNYKAAGHVPHIPVLASEVLEALRVNENSVFLDMTFGSGGHSHIILESDPSAVVYGLDRDHHTKKYASNMQMMYPDRFHSMTGKFSNLLELLTQKNIGVKFFDGILMDLGPSSMQFDDPIRGFMLSQSGPLDMRMDGNTESDDPTAADFIAYMDEESLYSVLKYYGEEKRARRIARAIIESRSLFKRLKTTKELANLIEGIVGSGSTDKLQRYSHPATKTFQAIRILVNDELNELDYGIRLSHHFLKQGGIMCAISFHSLEDKILKAHFHGYSESSPNLLTSKGVVKPSASHMSTYSEADIHHATLTPWLQLNKHVITPSGEEMKTNPRSRSAKLRVASKTMYSY